MELNTESAKEERARHIRLGTLALIVLTWIGVGISLIIQRYDVMGIIVGAMFIAGGLALIAVALWFIVAKKKKINGQAFVGGDVAITVLAIGVPIALARFLPSMLILFD